MKTHCPNPVQRFAGIKIHRAKFILPCLCFAVLTTLQAQGLRFISCNRVTNGISMKWSDSISGQSYILQTRDRINGGIWLIPDAAQPWPTVQTQWNEPMSSNPGARCYRVVRVQPANRGKLRTANLLQSYTTNTLNTIFSANEFPVTAQFGVNYYKVDYETIDPLGGKTTASGAIFLPQNVGKTLPLLSYQHGTTTLTNDVASVLNGGEYLAGLVLASAGYAVALPDYLGLGDSPGFHPYVHARSEATAGVDMLRATRQFCASNGIALNGQVFLIGYSQGGHATMALHREIEKYHTNEFAITASAPMAGPYDMSGVEFNDMLASRCPPNPYYYPYVFIAYQYLYTLSPNWSGIFAAPYDTTLPALFNGNIDGSVINTYLPACNISNIMSAVLLAALQNDPNCPLREALRDNDVDQWKPIAPMRMYHCAADADVPYANSQVAYSNFLAQGATQVQLNDPAPDADHDGCFMPAFLAAKAWFDLLKQ
jgi:pimeloyl-ACP methyl ester carboxylesterase